MHEALGRATGTIVKEAPEPTPQERKFENLDETNRSDALTR